MPLSIESARLGRDSPFVSITFANVPIRGAVPPNTALQDSVDDDVHVETDMDTFKDNGDDHSGDEGHETDDDHHSDQPFTWRTLLPLLGAPR